MPFDTVLDIGEASYGGLGWPRLKHWISILKSIVPEEVRKRNRLWRLLCAEAISTGPGESWKALPEDEAMFLCWFMQNSGGLKNPLPEAVKVADGSPQKEYVSAWSESIFGETEYTAQELLQCLRLPAAVEGTTQAEWYQWVLKRPESVEIISDPDTPLLRKCSCNNDQVEERTRFLGHKVYHGSFGSTAAAVMGQSIAKATSRKRLFCTENGRVGLGPQGTRAVDELFLLQGGNTPFVHRPKALCSAEVVEWNGDRDKLVSYGTAESPIRMLEFVGDCYVQGVMDGELLPGSSDGSAGPWSDIAVA